MAEAIVRSEEDLREIIKAPPGTVTAKISAGPLAVTPSQFLTVARLGVVTLTTEDGPPRIFAVGGPAGFVAKESGDGSLIVPLPLDLREEIATAGSPVGFAGMLLMVPGVKHTLRVNGPAAVSSSGDTLTLVPDQSYPHCAKAFIRSELWKANRTTVAPDAREAGGSVPPLDDVAVGFIASSPFVALGTSLGDSDADVSPRGDPPGFVQVIGGDRLFIPERPGNRIADSLRNIIANSEVSLLFMVPGDPRILTVAGQAVVTTDPELCATAEVNGKIPKLGVLVTVETVTIRPAPALVASDAWNTNLHVSESDVPTIGALVADPGGSGSLARRAMSGLADRAVGVDYKRNLY